MADDASSAGNEGAQQMDIGDWLRSLGLGEYEAIFRENKIDGAVLPKLTADDLKELGVRALGDRRKLLDGIAGLDAYPHRVTAPATALTDSLPREAAERRQVTLMFSDLVSSTALSARMDPEDLREVITAYQKRVAETVQRFGGFVAKYLGDGVLVYFGYPQAHEDDAERAVRAGLDLITAVGSLKVRAPLETRIGIATGMVVIGDLIGSGSAQEQAVVGETPNLAARLQAIAEPNMVVIAESTRRLLGNLFELKELGAQDLKGMTGPVSAWAALRPGAVESRFEALHGSGLTNLVGREEELEVLVRRWSKATTGEGQLVLLSGEAGIGKSRLTAALLERLAAEPHMRLRYFCSPQHTDSALYPIIGQMERAAGFAHGDTSQVKLDKLDTLLAQTSTSAQAVALFADMLSLPNDARYPVLDISSEQRRQRTLEALGSQMEALSRSKPVLMIFEDAHWADPTSLEALSRVVDRLRKLRVLLIVTFRPEFDPPWIGRPYVTALTLNRLAQRDIEAMIDGVLGNKRISASIRKDIIERTDGIPLFVEEMTKAVLEAESENEAQRTAAAIPSPAAGVPPSLQASLMARLDRLGGAKQVAQIGAAIGREFSHALLSAVVSKPEPQMTAALNRLIAAGLLFRQGLPPHATYLFKHALVQDAAYGTLLREPRRALHTRVAETLESQFIDIAESQPELLARHFTEAGQLEKAVGYWLKAGQKAVARSAMAEALAQLQRGLQLLDSLPEGPSRQQQELDLRVTLGAAQMATRGYAAPEANETYARARDLCEQLNWPSQFVSVLYGQFLFRLCYRSDLALAVEIAADLRRLGEERNDEAARLMGYHLHGLAHLWRGDFVVTRNDIEYCLKQDIQAHRAVFAALTAEDSYVSSTINLSCALSCLGYADKARATDAEALSEADKLGLAYTQVLALGLNFCNWPAQTPEVTLKRAERVIALATEHGFPMFQLLATIVRGWCVAVLGQPEEGITQLQQGVAIWRSSGAEVGIPFMFTLLADAYGKAGQPKEGLKQFDEALRSMEVRNEGIFETEMYRIRGELFISISDFAAAEQSFSEALSVARRQRAKLFELRAAMSMARLWRDQGKRDEARELLAPVYGWFTEGFDTLDLQEAKRLLEELAS
jgi:class 3 adenylate cyclase/predicted ATPase